jgi:hypothetical protein
MTMRQTNAKKLRLARETVAVLQSVELTDINGGVVQTGCVSGCTKCPGDPPTGQDPLASVIGCPPKGTGIFTGTVR